MTIAPIKFHPPTRESPLATRLRRETQSEVLFDAYTRGRYSTDASIYQIEPVGVVIPKTEADARLTLQIARESAHFLDANHVSVGVFPTRIAPEEFRRMTVAW